MALTFILDDPDEASRLLAAGATVPPVETYDLPEAAQRCGVGVGQLARFVELGILTPDEDGRFSAGHLRRAGLVKSLVASGVPLEGLGAAIRSGAVTLDFLDAQAFERFSALSGATFAEMAERTGLPVEQLMFVREAAGSVAPHPDDRVRDEELPYIDLIETAAKGGIRPAGIQQMVRTQSDSMRRIAETESVMWQAEVIGPAMSRGMRPDEILGGELGDRMSALTERSVIAMYHLQQARAWTENIISGMARDILTEALFRIEAAGYAITMHVHDEVVAEIPIGFGSEQEFTNLMTRKPAWALELPIAASAWRGPRFCK